MSSSGFCQGVFDRNLQFRQWGRVTGKDQRGEDGNELAKGVECGD